MGLLQNISTKSKVLLGIKALGLNNQETLAVNELVSVVGDNIVTEAIIGRRFTDVSDVAAAILDRSGDLPAIPPALLNLLQSPQQRAALADFVIGKIVKLKRATEVESVLAKISDLPVFGKAPGESWTDMKHFVSEGLIKTAGEFIADKQNQDDDVDLEEPLVISTCPRCKHIHVA